MFQRLFKDYGAHRSRKNAALKPNCRFDATSRVSYLSLERMRSGSDTPGRARANALVKKPLPWSLPCLKFGIINFQVSGVILLQNILTVSMNPGLASRKCHFILTKIHLR